MKIIFRLVVLVFLCTPKKYFGQNTTYGTMAPGPTTGVQNSLFGWSAGYFLGTGSYNSIFGVLAGRDLSTGQYNSYFGRGAGVQAGGNLSRNSYFGALSGANNNLGINNVFLGFSSGGNSYSSGSTFVGYRSGLNDQAHTDHGSNVFVGFQSGLSNTAGYENAFLGYNSGYNNLTGNNNTFLGFLTGYNNTTGEANTFVGNNAGSLNTGASYNSFFGNNSGQSHTSGDSNTFLGNNSGQSNTSGENNTFLGNYSGSSNILGSQNTFVGANSGLFSASSKSTFVGYAAGAKDQAHTVHGSNVFVGFESGYSNNTGYENAFLGYNSGKWNLSGYQNTFLGNAAGNKNTVGRENSFIGSNSGYNNTDGVNNTFLGSFSGYNNTIGNHNTFIGNTAGNENNDGSDNTFVGERSGINHQTGNGNSYLGVESGSNDLTGAENVYLGAKINSDANSGTANFGNTITGVSAGGQFIGNYNTISGYTAAYQLKGDNNVISGYNAARQLTDAKNNVFLGSLSGENLSYNSEHNVFIGYKATGLNVNTNGTTTTNGLIYATAIGANAVVGQSNSVVIGNVEIPVYGQNPIPAAKVGIGVLAPTNILHVVAKNDPLRLEGLNTSNDDNFLVVDNQGVVKKRSLSEITAQDDDWRWYSTNPADYDVNHDIFHMGTVSIGYSTSSYPNSNQALNVNGNLDISNAYLIENTNALSFKGGSESITVGKNSSPNFGNPSLSHNLFIGHGAGQQSRARFLNNQAIPDRNILLGNAAGANLDNPILDYNNIYIGVESGSGSLVAGSHNSVIGNLAGKQLIGSANSILGYNSGIAAEANECVFIGASSGSHNFGDKNTIIGPGAGKYNGSSGLHADENSFCGFDAGENNLGSRNSFFGYRAGRNNHVNGVVAIGYKAYSESSATDAGNGVFVGENAGLYTSAVGNTFVGSNAGKANTVGYNNTIVGSMLLTPNLDASSKKITLLGAEADALFPGLVGLENAAAIGAGSKVDESDVIVMGDNSTIPGPFPRTVRTRVCIGFNGVNSSLLPNTGMLYVNGDAYSSGFWLTSDSSFKREIKTLGAGLDIVKKLRPVSYYYKETKGMNFSDKLQYGFIAQELEKWLPNAVNKSNAGKYAVNYIEIIPVLTKALQEQSEVADQVKAENETLKSDMVEIMAQVNTMKQEMEKLKTCLQSIICQDAPNAEIAGPWMRQNQPNPVVTESSIDYYIPANVKNAAIKFYDMTGKEAAFINLSQKGPGIIKINNLNLSQGVYTYSLITDGKIISSYKMEIVKN